MAEIVNLRRARRQRAREDDAAAAAANRAKYGRTPAEKAAPLREEAARDRALDNARLPSAGDGELGK